MALIRKLNDCWLAWYVILSPVLTLQENPQRITTCSCRYENLTYDLSPLAMTNNEPRFTCDASAGYLFSYNPCLSFTQPNQTGTPDCTNVAICYWSDRASDYHLPYGYQHNIHCVLRDGNVALRYRYKEGLYSYVELICNRSQTDMKNAFKWISGTTEPVFQVHHRYICPREIQPAPPPAPTSNQELLEEKKHWLWTAIGELIILFLIIIVGVIICVYKSCKRPDEPHDVHEPLLNPPQPPPGNPYYQPPILEPNDDILPYDVIPPPDDFNVQPQREQEDQPVPEGNHGGQNGEQPREVEPRNEPGNVEPGVGDEDHARPNGQRNENEQPQPVVDPENEPAHADLPAIGRHNRNDGHAPHPHVRIPVERSATSDEDSMN